MRCGVEGSQVSDGGGTRMFSLSADGFRIFFSPVFTDYELFCYKDVVLYFLFAVRFLEQVVLKCVF